MAEEQKTVQTVEQSTGLSPDEENRMRERRELLQKIGSGVFASLLMSPLMATPIKEALTAPDTTQKLTSLPEVPEGQPDEDPIIRMVRDLKRALQKPMEERKWSMVIDLRKCVGCHACTVGCIAENKLPPGVVYRPVLEEEIGTFPHVARRFIPRPCMQCEEPPCTTVCPVNATWKRKDGIVEIDYDQCIGCRYCITACPYSARTFDTGHYYTEDAPSQPAGYLGSADARVYETAPNYDYGQERPRVDEQSPIGNARKCHFCVHRLEKGMLPECVVTCIGRATFFGDANDPESLVSELIPQPNVMRLKEEMGTKPKVHYLM